MNILTQVQYCLSKRGAFFFFLLAEKDSRFFLHWFSLSFPFRLLFSTLASDISLIRNHGIFLSFLYQIWHMPPNPHTVELVL